MMAKPTNEQIFLRVKSRTSTGSPASRIARLLEGFARFAPDGALSDLILLVEACQPDLMSRAKLNDQIACTVTTNSVGLETSIARLFLETSEIALDLKELQGKAHAALLQRIGGLETVLSELENAPVYLQRQNAGISSGEQRKVERQPEWEKWQSRADEIFKKNPKLSKSAIANEVAKEFRVTGRAVSRRISNVGKPRAPKK